MVNLIQVKEGPKGNKKNAISFKYVCNNIT